MIWPAYPDLEAIVFENFALEILAINPPAIFTPTRQDFLAGLGFVFVTAKQNEESYAT